MDLENFSFKCSKIVKNASYLKKARLPSSMNAKKQIAVDIYFLLSNQSARKGLSTCLAILKENIMQVERKFRYIKLQTWLHFTFYNLLLKLLETKCLY